MKLWVAEIGGFGVHVKIDTHRILGVYSTAELGKAAVERILSSVEWERYVFDDGGEYYGTNEVYHFTEGFTLYETWWVAVIVVELDVDYERDLMPSASPTAAE